MTSTFSRSSLNISAAFVLLATTTFGASNIDARQATPGGFDKYMVFMASGVIDANNPNPQPGVTGCNPLFCDGEYFQEEIMGRSDAEILLFEQEAKDFFLQRFGVDVDAAEQAGRVGFRMFMTNPDWEYRMFTLSDSSVPGEGWKVRDGGFVLQIIDPDGFDLGGDFAGEHAPSGSVMFYGNYNILVEKRRGRTDEIVMLFKSRVPGRIASDGSVSLRCELEHQSWGTGFASVTVANVPLEDGLIQGVGRNVLTFPPFPSLDDFEDDSSEWEERD